MTDWCNRATSDVRQILIWDGHWPAMNWSVLCGREGGLFVLDADGAQGVADLARLESELGPLPATWRVRSGRSDPGEHVYLRYPPGEAESKNQQPLPGTKVDVRAWHGQVLIPGSIHQSSGRRYDWIPGCSRHDLALPAICPPSWWGWLPKKEFGSDSAVLRPRTSRGPCMTREHDSRSRLIGDGPGYGGFQDAISANARDYFFRAGADASESIIVETLRDMIANAPKGEGRDVSRYLTGNDLPRLVARAREFVKQVKDQESDRKCEPASHPG